MRQNDYANLERGHEPNAQKASPLESSPRSSARKRLCSLDKVHEEVREQGFPNLQKAPMIWSETAQSKRTGKPETILPSPEVINLLSRDILYYKGEDLAQRLGKTVWLVNLEEYIAI